MTQATNSRTNVANRLYESNEPAILDDIWKSECGVAIYNHQVAPAVINWLAALPPEKLPEVRLTLKSQQVQDALISLCKEHDLTEDPCCQLFINDIVTHVGSFAHIMKTDRITLRLDVVSDNACRKFHQDNVSARMLCSYRGRGTEFGLCAASPEPEHIQEVPLGAVAIFKGRLWPDYAPSAYYHRSPQIEGTGETRLLLVIDKALSDND